MAKLRGRAASTPMFTPQRGATALLAVALAGTVILPSSVEAAGPVSQSRADFVSGTVLGSPLSDVVSLQPAKAANVGGASVVQTNPLGASALQAIDVSLGSGLNLLGSNPVLSLGAVTQYAQADPDGSSRSASGAVTDTGLDLAPLLGRANLQNVISSGTLTAGALSATATQTASGDTSGTYRIASLTLDATSPAIAGLTSTLRTSLAALQPTVNALPAAIRAIPAVGSLATISGIPTLTSVLANLGSVTTADGSISADLQTGALSIDVAAVLKTAGLDLNGLAPNTDLLPYVTGALTTQLLPAVTDAVNALTDDLTRAVNGISVSVLGVPVALAVLKPVLDPVIAQVTAPVITASQTVGPTVITPLATTLDAVLGLRAHVQDTGSTFREHALRIAVLPGAGTPATVDLASAAVGPNAGPLVAAPTVSALNPTHGPTAGGQTVTITGTGFVADATTVTLGGTTVPAGAVTVTSPTSLTFTTPAHPAGDVSATVTTGDGTSGPLGYTYDPDAGTPGTPDAPTATGLDPTHGPAAGGQTVTITGTGFVADATTVTLGGTTVPAGGVTVTSPTSLTFTTPAHPAGDVSATVTTGDGTSGPLDYTYDAVPASSSNSPTPVISSPTPVISIPPAISVAPAVGGSGHGGATVDAVSTGPTGAATGGRLAITGLGIASIVAVAVVLAMAGAMLQLGAGRRRY